MSKWTWQQLPTTIISYQQSPTKFCLMLEAHGWASYAM